MPCSIQAPINPNLWNPSNLQTISDASATEMDESHPTSAPYSTYDLGWNGTNLDYDAVFQSCLPDPYPNSRSLLRPVSQDTRDIGAHFHGDPTVLPYIPRSLHEVPPRYPIHSNNHTIPGPFPPHHALLHHPFSQITPRSVTGSDLQPYSTIYHLPSQGSTESVRHRRPARAIKYDGLWIDETELQQGLAEPNGNISVHQCR